MTRKGFLLLLPCLAFGKPKAACDSELENAQKLIVELLRENKSLRESIMDYDDARFSRKRCPSSNLRVRMEDA